MHIPDLINGTYETLGAAAVFLNVRQIYRDKKVAGFHPLALVYFTSWGAWNLFYYPHLGQWVSTVGALATFALNFVYLSLTLRYIKKA